MKYQKKNLWFLVSAAVLSLAFVSGCGDEEDKNKGKDGGDKPVKPVPTPGASDTYNLRKWGKVDAAAVGGAVSFNAPVASKNGKWLYVNTDKGFQAADLSDFEAGLKGKWTTNLIKDTGTGLSGVGAGNAKFESNKELGTGNQPYRGLEIQFYKPSENGVVVSVDKKRLVNNASDFGVISIVGDKIKNAWAGESPDILTGASSTDVISARTTICPYTVASATGEVLNVTTRADWDWIGVGALASNPIDKAIKGAEGSVWGNHKFYAPRLLQEKAGEPVYIVDQKAIRVLPADKIGLAYEFPKEIDGLAFDEQNTSKKVGSDVWGGGKAIKDRTINDVVIAGGKIYLAPADGGMVVYDIKASTMAYNKKSWTGSAIQLAVDGDEVWGVTAKGLNKVSADASNGGPMTVSVVAAADRKKDGNYDESDTQGTLLPGDKIMGAAFVKGNLVIATSDGLVFSIKSSVKM